MAKMMSSLGLALLAMASTTAASEERGSRWWAVSVAVERIYLGNEWASQRVSTYGAAWDFPSAEKAAEAALKACQEHVPDPWNERRWLYGGCKIYTARSNSCFAIIKEIIHTEDLGTVVQYGVLDRRSRAQTQAAAARRVARIANTRHRRETAEIELIECAGVE